MKQTTYHDFVKKTVDAALTVCRERLGDLEVNTNQKGFTAKTRDIRRLLAHCVWALTEYISYARDEASSISSEEFDPTETGWVTTSNLHLMILKKREAELQIKKKDLNRPISKPNKTRKSKT